MIPFPTEVQCQVLERLYHHPCLYQEWMNRCAGIFHPVKVISSVRKDFVEVTPYGPRRDLKIFSLNALGKAVVAYYRLSRGIPRRGGFQVLGISEASKQ